MRHLVAEAGLDAVIEVDSAGTGAWHAGNPPDPRSTEEAARRGLKLVGEARQFEAADFDRFDYVLVTDSNRYDDVCELARDVEARSRVHNLLKFDPGSDDDAPVPDPYYGGATGFADVFDLCELACRGLLEHLRRHHGLS